ncbi:hypothetical protein [Enterococcus gallinarum]|uniref:hypothetical protein n=1 Tax=Enterococcus gallinarum TaxID=1353 RepID=UPI00214AFE62|nr:hypothetical protein [Enterococcus gallinarum]MCR1931649.1 hypothetical protein [Enterococcus gallinarum]
MEGLEKQSKGFFQEGDCIEVSGKIIGFVVKADEQTFGLSRIFDVKGKHLLCPDISMYSNEAQHYTGKYWIKKVPAPNEYKVMEVGLFKG